MCIPALLDRTSDGKKMGWSALPTLSCFWPTTLENQRILNPIGPFQVVKKIYFSK